MGNEIAQFYKNQGANQVSLSKYGTRYPNTYNVQASQKDVPMFNDTGSTVQPTYQPQQTTGQYGPSRPTYEQGLSSAGTGLDESSGTKWLGSDGALAGIASGVTAASGLANAYLGYKNYNLAQDQFKYQKDLGNRNLINQASSYNTNLQNSADVGMSLAGATMSAADRDAYNAKIAGQKLSQTGV